VEKILISLVLIALNVGLYLTFVLSERLSISRNIILLFYLFFLIVATVSWISKGSYLELVQSSIYLLGMHLLALLSFKFFFPMVTFHNPTYQELLKVFFNYILLPIATLATTVWQVFFLFDTP
jgi:hypothetical protein